MRKICVVTIGFADGVYVGALKPEQEGALCHTYSATTVAGVLHALGNSVAKSTQPAGGIDHAEDSSLESLQTALEPVQAGQTSANSRQVGGQHYKGTKIEHWDWCLAQPWGWGYMVGQIAKYASRYKYKNGMQDLEKARHFLDKLIEFESAQQQQK